ncbi:MAG TPA: glutathione peroxidase [Clostridiales bacterium]|nr:MAG: glutathione peroxidase [Clostridiales bacterium GWD2_32_19]HCC07562.1 glutathione peroxidase [Clostridiales bacterium]
MNIYDFKANTISGVEKDLGEYRGKVVLIVNTASKCGLTTQYRGLEALYKKYGSDKFVVLGFPCNQFARQEPSSNEVIENFCRINFGVTFPLFEKIEVNGDGAHPLFKYLTSMENGLYGEDIDWNFTKFLVDRNGNAVKRFTPVTEPKKIEVDIEILIN